MNDIFKLKFMASHANWYIHCTSAAVGGRDRALVGDQRGRLWARYVPRLSCRGRVKSWGADASAGHSSASPTRRKLNQHARSTVTTADADTRRQWLTRATA